MKTKSKRNLISTEEALQVVSRYGKEVVKATLLKWVKTNNIGHQCAPRSRWYIQKDKLIRLLEKGKGS